MFLYNFLKLQKYHAILHSELNLPLSLHERALLIRFPRDIILVPCFSNPYYKSLAFYVVNITV